MSFLLNERHLNWLQALSVGDEAVRMLGGLEGVAMEMLVTRIDEGEPPVGNIITACPVKEPGIEYTFSQETSCEIDTDLGWDGVSLTGSFLIQKEETTHAPRT